MSIIGIYPGTFDPITYGHIDIIKRSLKIVNKLIIAVSNNFSKDYLFVCILVLKLLFPDKFFNVKNKILI